MRRNLQAEVWAVALPFQQPLQFRLSTQLTGGAAKGDAAARLAVQGRPRTQAQAAVCPRLSTGHGGAVSGGAQTSLAGMLDADLGQNGDAIAAKVATLFLGKLALDCAAAEKKCRTLRTAGIADAAKTRWPRPGLEVSDVLVQLPQRARNAREAAPASWYRVPPRAAGCSRSGCRIAPEAACWQVGCGGAG